MLPWMWCNRKFQTLLVGTELTQSCWKTGWHYLRNTVTPIPCDSRHRCVVRVQKKRMGVHTKRCAGIITGCTGNSEKPAGMERPLTVEEAPKTVQGK